MCLRPDPGREREAHPVVRIVAVIGAGGVDEFLHVEQVKISEKNLLIRWGEGSSGRDGWQPPTVYGHSFPLVLSEIL